MTPEANEPTSPVADYQAFKSADRAAREPKAPETAADPKPKEESPSAEKREPEVKTEPATENKPLAESAAPKGETAEVPATRKKEAQEEVKEQPKEKRDRTAKGRVQELLAEGRFAEAEKVLQDSVVKAEKERADKAEKELQEFRTRKPAEPVKPEPVAEAAPPKPEAKPLPSAESDPRPSLKAIVQKASDGIEPYAGKEHEELSDMWSDELDQWREREAGRKQAAADAQKAKDEADKRQKTEAQQAEAKKREYDASIVAAQAKYPDYEQVLKTAIDAYPNLANNGIGAGIGASRNPGELRYALAKDGGAEYARIAALSVDDAFAETLWLDRHIAKQAGKAPEPEPAAPAAAAPPAAPDPPPEKPKPAVSKAPAPYTPVSGVEEPSAKKPTSYAEAKKLALAQSHGHPRA